MKIAVYVTTALLLIGIKTNVRAQAATTNKGTEFWTAFMVHADPPGIRGCQMDLYITSDVNTSGTVSVADGSFTQNFTVTANQVTIIPMPASAFLGIEGQFLKGIHITSIKPIAIYGHIFYSAVSGATLLLPVNTLGKDYYSINYTQVSNSLTDEMIPSYSAFIVIATEDNTTVEITPTQTLTSGNAANKPFNITLKKGELYQGLSSNDLSGTRIRTISTTAGACTKIAVFSGSSKISIDCDNTPATSDNLFQQVYPTASWGKTYITVPLQSRQYDVIRVIFNDPTTNATLNGQPIRQTGFYYEFNSNTPNVITADKPIQVVQYAVSENKTANCSPVRGDVGDPEMIFLNPLEQTIDHVTLYSTTNYNIINEFINVVIPTPFASTFVLDGTPYNNFTPVAGNPAYSYAQINVNPGTHNISASTGFNAIAYGFGSDESYGYAAGTNLQNLTEFIALTTPADTISHVNGCTGVNYKLQVTLPYQTTSIKWDLRNGTTYTDNNPVVTSTVQKQGQTLYNYQYPDSTRYNSGNYTVVATVFDPLADACGSNEDIELDFNIADPPDALFTSGKTCLGDSTVFTNTSDPKGSIIKSWAWDFGDGSTSILQNPTHVFVSPGDHQVTLMVTNENGCTSSPDVQITHIANRPIAAFSLASPACAGQAVSLKDKSTSIDGMIAKWIFDYGDNTHIDTNLTNQSFVHTYADTGAYTIKMTVVLSSGCLSNVDSVKIHVSPLPVVNFSIPDVCLADSYAQFTNKSTIPDHTEAGFTFLWNFGDPNATASNPNSSTLANPTHKYTQIRDTTNPYQVTLTVTSASGCSFSKMQAVTVNGDTPVAGFAVENKNNLCSSDSVIFDNLSSVNFGSVTKIVWYFDYNNNPTDTVVFHRDSIPANNKFSHKYPLFSSPLTKSYTVRMDAYSGQTCMNTTTRSISILANPMVNLSVADSLCQNAQPVQIIENTNGFTGTGVFSGTGVSATGLFDPSVAGVGHAAIKYQFTAQNGCSYDTVINIKVNPAPVIMLPSTLTILEGGSSVFRPLITGNNLTYLWYPSTGLNYNNIADPTVSPAEDMEYQLTVTSAQGCSSTANILVTVLKVPVIPNTFTPNGDGINDTWEIKYLNTYPNNTVDIYNRYGEKVYSSVGYAVPWDGRFNGADLPVGVYYYIINPKNGRKVLSGYVTIIR